MSKSLRTNGPGLLAGPGTPSQLQLCPVPQTLPHPQSGVPTSHSLTPTQMHGVSVVKLPASSLPSGPSPVGPKPCGRADVGLYH